MRYYIIDIHPPTKSISFTWQKFLGRWYRRKFRGTNNKHHNAKTDSPAKIDNKSTYSEKKVITWTSTRQKFTTTSQCHLQQSQNCPLTLARSREIIPALHPIPLRLNVRASERMLNLWLTIEHSEGVGEKRLSSPTITEINQIGTNI